MAAMSGSLEVDVHPPWPYRLPRRSGGDGTTRIRQGVLSRLLHVHDIPVIVHVWQRRSGEVILRAAATGPAGRDELEVAVERMRFALGVDDDHTEFFDEFKRDRVIGPALRARPWLRPRRRPWPWEALAWAITAQLIESSRAAQIQRRLVRRWGRALQPEAATPWTGPGPLRDVPEVGVVAGRAPAELASMDLSPARATAMIRCATEVAAGRVDLDDPAGDVRLQSIREIGPWTTQCLGLNGRGEADSLPAGDLAYVKLVGRLGGLGRRATIPEIGEFFQPYAPYRGLAGTFAITHYHLAVATGPPMRLAA
jgi:3-methyladenine DNA glycosylase/8-oxoguanine DNA glycosylase